MRQGILTLALIAFALSTAQAAEYNWERVLQAPADGTFFGIGDPRNSFDPYSRHPKTVNGVTGLAKRNGSYAWGVTSYKDDIWYGVLDNGWCHWLLPAGVPQVTASGASEGRPEHFTIVTEDMACENFSPDPNRPAENATAQTRIYTFNTTSKTLNVYRSDNPKYQRDIARAVSIRSAGTIGKTIFLAALAGEWDVEGALTEIILFAFDGDTKEYVDSASFKDYATIRSMKELQHPDGSSALYVAIGNDYMQSTTENHLLRWTGTQEDPFGTNKDTNHPGFEVAIDTGRESGNIGNFELIQISEKDYRIAATTWASASTSGGLYLSDPLPVQGFSAQSLGRFRSVVLLQDIEPDIFTEKLSFTGFMSVYKGSVYWGTMTAPLSSSAPYQIALSELCASSPDVDYLCDTAGYRPGAVYKTSFSRLPKRALDYSSIETELLYGDEEVLAMNPQDITSLWHLTPNQKGLKPKYGRAGFGYKGNNYTWTSVVYDGKLFIGTMDISHGVAEYVEKSGYDSSSWLIGHIHRHIQAGPVDHGGDLWVFEDENSPAKAITTSGMDNRNNTGFRNFAIVNGELYVGTSSMANLGDKAGYEFYKLNVLERR